MISADGSYSIGKQPVSGDFEAKVEWTPSDALKKGLNQLNTLRVDCAGDTLTMYINGQKVNEVHDPDLKAGTINLEAGSSKEATSATMFAFDNFTITRP